MAEKCLTLVSTEISGNGHAADNLLSPVNCFWPTFIPTRTDPQRQPVKAAWLGDCKELLMTFSVLLLAAAEAHFMMRGGVDSKPSNHLWRLTFLGAAIRHVHQYISTLGPTGEPSDETPVCLLTLAVWAAENPKQRSKSGSALAHAQLDSTPPAFSTGSCKSGGARRTALANGRRTCPRGGPPLTANSFQLRCIPQPHSDEGLTLRMNAKLLEALDFCISKSGNNGATSLGAGKSAQSATARLVAWAGMLGAMNCPADGWRHNEQASSQLYCSRVDVWAWTSSERSISGRKQSPYWG